MAEPRTKIRFTYEGLQESTQSPGTAERDRGYKKTLYARHGAKEYWLVDPEAKTVEVFTLREKGFELVRAYKNTETLRSPLLEGPAIDLQEVFAP